MKKAVWIGLALVVCGVSILPSCQRASGECQGERKLIVLGIDGMDPQLLTKFMQEGKMPNFAKLVARDRSST